MSATPVQSVPTRTRELPPNARRTAGGEHYSGYVIVRLRSGLASTNDATLFDAAKRLKLDGLAGLLQAFDLMATQRTVRSLKSEQILELERKAASTEFPPLHSLTSYWRIDLRDRAARSGSGLPRVRGHRTARQ
jgi:hypothetical protein